MKLFLPLALALAVIALVIALVMMKHGDTARQESDAGTIADFSNRVDTAQSLLTLRDGTILTFSNRLDEALAAASVISNLLTDAQSTRVLDLEQITNLNRQLAEVTEVKLENQTLSRRVMSLTSQIAGLTNLCAMTAASLAQTNSDLVQARKDSALLEHRFRTDVAERIVVERKFNNPLELQAQLKKLKQHPAGVISEDSIYAGLNVEVTSNGTCHVVAPH